MNDKKRAIADSKKRAIAVFAHNEERNIIRCLQTVKAAANQGDECFVLNNGSTDRTGDVVAAFIKDDPRFHLVEISVGDKSNAWNVFVHEIKPQASVYLFLDGDCWIDEYSFRALEEALQISPQANVASALPAAAVSPKFRQQMIAAGGVAGNLYALSPDFVHRLRTLEIYLPVGLVGDDSLVGALACWDLDPTSSWARERVVCCPQANFYYQRLSPFSISDLRLLYRRKIRYSLRRFQNLALRKVLKAQGLKALPRTIEETFAVNRAGEGLPALKWRSVDTYFDFLALRKIHKTLPAPGNRNLATGSRTGAD